MGYIGQAPGLGQELAFRFVGVAGQGVIAGRDMRGLPLVFVPRYVELYRNGHRLTEGDDYTTDDGSQIFPQGWSIQADDELIVVAKAPFSPADTYSRAEADASFNRRRNRSLDPGCRVAQQFGTTSIPLTTSSGIYYVSDGMVVQRGGTVGMASAQRIASPTPGGSGFRNRITVTTANPTPGAQDILRVAFPVEGNEIADLKWGTAAARPLLKRFGFKSPIAGTFPVSVVNASGTQSYVAATVTVQPGEVNSDLVRWIVIPGPTTGLWPSDNGLSFTISIALLAGPSYQGVAGWQNGVFYGLSTGINGMQTAGLSFDVFDFGMYDVSDITNPAPFRFELAPQRDDEFACFRYYWQADSANNAMYTVSTGGRMMNQGSITQSCYAAIKHARKMRIAPNTTITYDISDGGEQTASGQQSSTDLTIWGVTVPPQNFLDIHNFTASARMI
jgi:hypothetical protein